MVGLDKTIFKGDLDDVFLDFFDGYGRLVDARVRSCFRRERGRSGR